MSHVGLVLSLSLPLQLPNQITVSRSDQRYDMPLEVAGWILNNFNLQDRQWLLIITPDSKATLAVNLLHRWTVAVNIVMGMTEFASTQVSAFAMPPKQF